MIAQMAPPLAIHNIVVEKLPLLDSREDEGDSAITYLVSVLLSFDLWLVVTFVIV